MLEVENDAKVRVMAPIAAVWEEFYPFEQLLRHVPEVQSFTPGPDEGGICGRLAWDRWTGIWGGTSGWWN